MKINLLSVILAAIIAILLFFSGFFIGKTRNPLKPEKVISTLTDSIKAAVYTEFALLRSATTERVDTVYKWGTKTKTEVEYIYVETESPGINEYTSESKSNILTIRDTLIVEGYVHSHTRDVKLDTPYIYSVVTLRDTVTLEKERIKTEFVSRPALFVGADIQHIDTRLNDAYNPRFGMNVSLGYMNKKRQMFYINKSITDAYTFSLGYGYKLW